MPRCGAWQTATCVASARGTRCNRPRWCMRRICGLWASSRCAGHTLQPTAVVHEAYLRLVGQQQVDWRNRAQVLGLAARMMRRVLLDYADRRNAAKRFDAHVA